MAGPTRRTSSHALPSPLGLTADEFVRAVAGHVLFRGIGGKAGALDLYKAVFREGPDRAGDAFELLGIRLPSVVRELREQSDEGEVIKFLSRIDRTAVVDAAEGTRVLAPTSADIAQRLDHLEIESVLIPMRGSTGALKYTLCVSSQVGCAMGCTFCETAQMGLVRSLTPAEIVGQWYVARHVITRGGSRPQDHARSELAPSNIVFMGMGEPMDNLDSVIQAIAVLKDHSGPHVPVSCITVSTVGRVDGIRRLGAQATRPGWHRLGIAFSLNSPNDADRSRIMPITRKYTLADVQQALIDWPRYAGNKICVEYVLIPTQNDSREHARQIASFMAPFGLHKTATSNPTNAGMRAVLNLIPYNPRRNSPWPAPTEAQVEEFMGWLEDEGVFVKRRRTKGRQMMGACGQLGTEQIRQRKVVLTVGAGSAPSASASDA